MAEQYVEGVLELKCPMAKVEEEDIEAPLQDLVENLSIQMTDVMSVEIGGIMPEIVIDIVVEADTDQGVVPEVGPGTADPEAEVPLAPEAVPGTVLDPILERRLVAVLAPMRNIQDLDLVLDQDRTADQLKRMAMLKIRSKLR